MDRFLEWHSRLAYWTSLVDWEAWGAVATLAAVLVALCPIYQGWKRDVAHARSVRIRIGTHLTTLLPTLEDWKGSRGAVKGALSPRQFKQIVSELMALMQESSALEPDEQDHLSVILTNLSGLALLYQNGLSADVLAQSGDNQREMIRKLQALFGKHGILSGPIEVPWDPPPPGVP